VLADADADTLGREPENPILLDANPSPSPSLEANPNPNSAYSNGPLQAAGTDSAQISVDCP
jgi:hypothetical protein